MSKSVWGAQEKIGSLHVGVDGVARKVLKGYVGVQGKARLFYESESKIGIAYTGTYTTEDLTVDGVKCTLYKLTSSGTLTVTGDSVKTWMCGGGSNGGDATSYRQPSLSVPEDFYAGGTGGGGGYPAEGELVPGTYTVTIGAAQAATAIQGPVTIKTAANNRSVDGGTGGGASGTIYVSEKSTRTMNNWTGSGKGSKAMTPFGVITEGYGAGGGGGCATGYDTYGGIITQAGNLVQQGGSNGASRGGSSDSTVQSGGGSGGTKGGGKGGGFQSKGSAATFYGSGGGGGSVYVRTTYDGGSGYQGIAMIIVPKDKEAS